jgi:hypothetical protein
MCPTTTKDQLAEILVVRDQDALLARRARDDVLVVGLGHRLGHCQRIMAVAP